MARRSFARGKLSLPAWTKNFRVGRRSSQALWNPLETAGAELRLTSTAQISPAPPSIHLGTPRRQGSQRADDILGTPNAVR